MSWRERGRVLVVGLGNPGPKYALTRHNFGFMLADNFAREVGIDLSREKFKARYGTGEAWGRSVVVIEPQTFMNRSGFSVAQALSFYSDVDPANTVLLYDDLDLEFGVVRVKIGGGHGGHNGLRSIFADTGSRDYVRIRLGIGRPKVGDATAHVLARFDEVEFRQLEDIIDRGIEALKLLFEKGPTAAMNEINARMPKGETL